MEALPPNLYVFCPNFVWMGLQQTRTPKEVKVESDVELKMVALFYYYYLVSVRAALGTLFIAKSRNAKSDSMTCWEIES